MTVRITAGEGIFVDRRQRWKNGVRTTVKDWTGTIGGGGILKMRHGDCICGESVIACARRGGARSL